MKRVLILLLALSGCASAPQQAQIDYQQLAAQKLVPPYCASKGWMNTAVAGQAAFVMQKWESALPIDQGRYIAAQNMVNQSLGSLNPEQCRRWEVTVIVGIEADKAKQRDAQYQQEEAQRLTDKMASPTGRTYCNRIGNQVLCNSY